jgi:hypothetical protein
MARLSAAAWVLLVCGGVGCGYRFVPRDRQLPAGVRAVCAPVFVNETPEPALETLFTRAFRQELVRAGTLGEAGCDATVEGAVLGVGSAPTIVTLESVLASYRASATVRLRLIKDGRVLRETVVSGGEDFLPGSGDILEAETNRQAALHRLSETLMREGYERLASGG